VVGVSPKTFSHATRAERRKDFVRAKLVAWSEWHLLESA
jgi:hypothetical protein